MTTTKTNVEYTPTIDYNVDQQIVTALLEISVIP